nr:hypothetical protein [Vibrio vulnificus]
MKVVCGSLVYTAFTP